jgi:hypothetical protein
MILLQNLQLTYSCDLMVATSADVRVFLQVRELDGGDKSSIERCPESSCLSELRILCSLGTHPCIVTFYGHQFMNMQDRSLQLLIFMEHIQGGSLEVMIGCADGLLVLRYVYLVSNTWCYAGFSPRHGN